MVVEKLAQCSGFKMYVNPKDDNLSEKIFQSGIWEPESTVVVRENLHEGDVFVDCGANIGYYTCLAATIVGPKGSVIAFEPSSTHFSYLAENVRLNGFTNVITLPFALWSEQTRFSLIEPDHGNTADTRVSSAGELTVQAYMLDQIVYRADFLKTDCQGADPSVLLGARRLIQNSDGLKLLLEMNNWWPSLIELHINMVKSIGSDQNIFCVKTTDLQESVK